MVFVKINNKTFALQHGGFVPRELASWPIGLIVV